MRKQYSWILLVTCQTGTQLDTFLDTQKSRLVSKSQPEVCQLCTTNLDVHPMRYVIYKCNSKTCSASGIGHKCSWLLKVLSCDIEDVIYVYQHGSHLSVAPPSPRPGDINLSMARFIGERAQAGDKPAQAMNKMVLAFKTEVTDAKKLLSKVQYLVRRYRIRALNDNDFVDVTVKLASQHRFRSEMSDTDPFSFGFSTDLDGLPILGEATDDSPLIVGFATKSSIRRLEHASSCVVHLDATFKLSTLGYPVIVIGLSDMWRQFHPVCFFLVSDLKQPQWQLAIRATFELYQNISGKQVQLSFVMMDADNAQRNAFEVEALRIFDFEHQPVFLMCFFHVMTNVRKHTLKFDEANKTIIYRCVYRIHYARTPLDKQNRIKEAIDAWDINPECRSFRTYFIEQWLSGRYNRWCCLETPTGMAKTNNPVENFNRQLKNQHTMRRLLRLNPLFIELLNCIAVRSILVKAMATSPRAAPHVLRDYRKSKALKQLSVSNNPHSHPLASQNPQAAAALVMNFQEQSRDRCSIAFITSLDPSITDRAAQTQSPDTSIPQVSSWTSCHDDDMTANTDCIYVLQRYRKDTVVPSLTLSTSELKADEEEDQTDEALQSEEQPRTGWIVNLIDESCTCRTWFKLGCCVHVMAALDAQGLPYDGSPPPRRTYPSKRHKKKRGRPAQVGHALSLQ